MNNNNKDLWSLDKKRKGALPIYQYFYRKALVSTPPLKVVFQIFLHLTCFLYKVELSSQVQIGAGLYIAHPYGITINPKAILGKNINIHKGVTIGQENRGIRKGTPIIGNCVWIGIHSTIVGKITVGDDVLIAPNTYVNCNIPSHSVVFGNPCIIKHRDNATDNYICNKI